MRAGETERDYYCIQDKRMSEPGERKKRQHNTHTGRTDKGVARWPQPTQTQTTTTQEKEHGGCDREVDASNAETTDYDDGSPSPTWRRRRPVDATGGSEAFKPADEVWVVANWCGK